MTSEVASSPADRSTAARQFYGRVEDAGGEVYLTCLLRPCKQRIKGENVSNFERHLMRFHPNEYTAVTMAKLGKRKRPTSDARGNGSKRRRCINGVRLDMQDILEACISLVTDSGRPFAAIDDPGLQRIVRALLDAMPPGERRAISSYTIRDRVREKAIEIREKIRSELSNKIISIKVDSASRGIRTFLGINAQYIQDGKIVLRPLALKELKGRATASNLKTVIQDVLGDYLVPVENVYGFTSDNGSNMVLAGAMLGQLQEDIERLERERGEEGWEEEDEEGSEEEDGYGVYEFEDEDEEEFGSDDDVPLAELARTSERERAARTEEQGEVAGCSMETSEGVVSCCRCAAHTLELGIGDAMKVGSTTKFVRKMRKLAKALRRKNTVESLRDMKLKMPTLNNATRWHSTEDMLLSLQPLRDFATRFQETAKLPKVSEAEWDRLDQLVAALKPAKMCIKKLQEEQLVMGDFYGAWLACKINTRKVGTPFARLLVAAMQNRESDLFEEPAFLSALYLDPRFFSMLSAEQMDTAEKHLVKLWKKVERVTRTAAEEVTTENPVSEDTSDDGVPPGLDELEQLLTEKDSERIISSGGSARVNILPKLKWFIAQPRLKPLTADVLKWWESKRFELPELYALAQVVLAMPATQVSVERLFSGMKFLLSDKRLRLTGEVTDQLSTIRHFNKWSTTTNSVAAGEAEQEMTREVQQSSTSSCSSPTTPRSRTHGSSGSSDSDLPSTPISSLHFRSPATPY